MAAPRWIRSLFNHSKRPTRPLQIEPLEDRLVPAVYYFNGGNLLNPDLDADGALWSNPWNWAKEEDGLFVGLGVPGAGDTAVFKGATEDGKSWTVYSKQKDGNGNYLSTQTFGRSVTGGGLVDTLNLDRNWGGTIYNVGGSITVTSGGRWQSGHILGNVSILSRLTVAPDSGSSVSVSLGTLTNSGTISVTSGSLILGQETGVVPYSGALFNTKLGTVDVSGTATISRASNPDSVVINEGALSGSGNATVNFVRVVSSGTLRSTGDFSLPAQVEIDGGTVMASLGNTLYLNTFSAFPHYGSTTWSGNVNVTGGGTVKLYAAGSNEGEMRLTNAVFNVASDTTFLIGNPNVSGNVTPRTLITGTGKLAAGSTITFDSGTFVGNFENDGTVILAGTSTPSALYEDNRLNGYFQNDGLLRVQAPSIYSAGVVVNSETGVLEFAKNCNYYGDGGLIQNLGTVRVASSVANVWIRAAFDNLNGTIDVRSGYLSLSNTNGPASSDKNTPRGKIFSAFGASPSPTGISIGGNFKVATGATLDLRSTDQFGSPYGVFAGNYTGSGGGTVRIGGNMQMLWSDWNFPANMLVWGATDETYYTLLTGSFTNSGELTLPTTTGSLVRSLRSGTLFNRGKLNFGSGSRLDLYEDFQPGTSSLINEESGTITFAGGNLVRGYGSNTLAELHDPSFHVFRNLGQVQFNGNTSLTGVVDNNAGTFEARNGAGVGIGYYRGRSPSLGADSLAGTWVVTGGSTISFDRLFQVASQPPVRTFLGTATLDGKNSSLPWLSGVDVLTGTLNVLNNATTTVGNFGAFTGDSSANTFTNSGELTLNGGTVSAPGTYTQTKLGTLSTIVGGPTTKLAVGKTATLGGELITGSVSGFVPAGTDRFDVITATTVTGTFAKHTANGYLTQITPTTVTLAPVSAAVDLTVSDVSIIPANGTEIAPGSKFTVQFTVRNLSSKAISGSWSDAVFLSSDDALGGTDVLLGRVADGVGLTAFGSRVMSVELLAPASPGSWSIIVAGDSQAELADPNRLNNIAVVADPLRVSYAELPLGVDLSASFPAGTTAYYRLTIPAGTGPVRITATNGGLLSARFAELPTGGAGDLIGNTVLDLSNTTAGVYFVAVTRTTNNPVVLRAEVPALNISGLENEASLSSRVMIGDTLSLTIHGTGFLPSTVFRLGSTVATSTTLINSTTAIVTFVVPASTTPLMVSASNGPTTNTYPGKSFSAVAVNPESEAFDRGANWRVQITMPNQARARRDIRAVVTFQNDSPFSQPAPLLQLAALGGLLRLPGQPSSGEESLQLLGVKSSGYPDLYAPGEIGSIEVILGPDLVNSLNYNLVATVLGEDEFVPAVVGASGPILPREGMRQSLPLDAGILEQLKPTTISQVAWDSAVRPNLATLLGTTLQSYADAVRGAASVLAQDGVDVRSVARVLTYLINVADDFGAISSRFRLSAFGFGQPNPFEIQASTTVDGHVLINYSGRFRPFVKIGDNNYEAVPGDQGVLTARTGGGWVLTERDGSLMTFRPDGLFDYTENNRGQRTTATYTNGVLTKLTDFQGDSITVSYNAGRIVAVTDAVGRVTNYRYDATMARLTQVSSVAGTVTYEYNPETSGPRAYTLAAVTGVDGVRSTFQYDSMGRVIRSEVARQFHVTYAYGQGATVGTVSVTDSANRTATFVLGQYGQLTATQDVLGRRSNANFDSSGWLTGYETPSSGPISINTDEQGNAQSTYNASGDPVRFTYDQAGLRLTSIRDNLGRQTAIQYDSRNLPTSITDPHGTIQFVYDAEGYRTARVLNSGRSVASTYNALNLVTRNDYSDGSYTTYQYDSHRNLSTATDYDAGGVNPRSVAFEYDAADRVTKVTYSGGRFVQYRYDAAGRLDRMSTSDGTTFDYTLDTLSRLVSVRRNGTVEVTYTYDALSRLSQKAFANGTSTVYTYDVLDRVTRIEHRSANSSILDFAAYTYNTADQIATLQNSDGTTAYHYDAIGQLIRVVPPTGSAITYQYDAVGNRLEYNANAANQYTSNASGETFTYDADGNLIATACDALTATQYSYDARGRLVYQNGPAGTFRYEYDAMGNRSAITQNGVRTEFLIDALGGSDGLGDILVEYSGGVATTTNILGLGLEARVGSSGSSRYFHYDLQGSTTAITNTTGTVTAAYRYEAFGKVVSLSGSEASENTIRFNGQVGVTDRGSGLLDMRNRFYDPATGRFTQRDPIGLVGTDVNLYRFGYNNPVSYLDPNGLNPLKITLEAAYDYIKATRPIQQVGKTGVIGTAREAGATTGIGRAVGDVESTSFYAARERYYNIQDARNQLFGEWKSAVTGSGGSVAGVTATALAVNQNVAHTTGLASLSLLLLSGCAAVVPGAQPAVPALLAAAGATGDISLASGLVDAAANIGANNNVALIPSDWFNHPQDVLNITPEFEQKLRDKAYNDPFLKTPLQQFERDFGRKPTVPELLEMMRRLKKQQNDLRNAIGRRLGARDPNDIVGPAGYGSQGYLQPVGEFPYMIRFQNIPTATAPAQVVTITQQLDADLNWNTFELTSFGWGNLAFDVPDGMRHYHTRVSDTARNAIVDVNATFNPSTGVLTWTLTTLDPQTLDQPADSVTAGFLPPDDANGVGQGFVSYRIQPKANASTGTRYDAQATIIFDDEAPLNTPAIFNTADRGTPTSQVNSLSMETIGTSVNVTWNGNDDGSGNAAYTIYVSVNGGAWQPWLTDTTQIAAVYTGLLGQRVSFYSVTSDNVGHVEQPPITADASTLFVESTVPTVPPVPPVSPPVTVVPPITSNPTSHSTRTFAVGADRGGVPVVQTFNSDGNLLRSATVFDASFKGGVRVAVGDFNGDGVEDTVVGTGPGSPTRVRVLDGTNGVELFAVDPFEAAFTGGVFVAAGDLTGDGRPELIISPDEGGGPRVRIFSGNGFTQLADFFGIDDPAFRGGARAAVADLNGDGVGDLLVSAGFGGGPRVAAYDGTTVDTTTRNHLFADFFAFELELRNGVYLTGGDLDGDGKAELIAGGGPGGGPRVTAFSGSDLLSNTATPLINFFAGDAANRGGVRVAVKNLDDDVLADLVVGSGTGGGTKVTTYLGKMILAPQPPANLEFDSIAGFSGGVFVG